MTQKNILKLGLAFSIVAVVFLGIVNSAEAQNEHHDKLVSFMRENKVSAELRDERSVSGDQLEFLALAMRCNGTSESDKRECVWRRAQRNTPHSAFRSRKEDYSYHIMLKRLIREVKRYEAGTRDKYYDADGVESGDIRNKTKSQDPQKMWGTHSNISKMPFLCPDKPKVVMNYDNWHGSIDGSTETGRQYSREIFKKKLDTLSVYCLEYSSPPAVHLMVIIDDVIVLNEEIAGIGQAQNEDTSAYITTVLYPTKLTGDSAIPDDVLEARNNPFQSKFGSKARDYSKTNMVPIYEGEFGKLNVPSGIKRSDYFASIVLGFFEGVQMQNYGGNCYPGGSKAVKWKQKIVKKDSWGNTVSNSDNIITDVVAPSVVRLHRRYFDSSVGTSNTSYWAARDVISKYHCGSATYNRLYENMVELAVEAMRRH